jgi:hypothetical protein
MRPWLPFSWYWCNFHRFTIDFGTHFRFVFVLHWLILILFRNVILLIAQYRVIQK